MKNIVLSALAFGTVMVCAPAYAQQIVTICVPDMGSNSAGNSCVPANLSNPLPAVFVGSYVHIASNTSTQIKSSAGFLHTITVNTPGATDTATIYDNTACSGTVIGVVNDATANATTLTYDAQFSAGLCIVTSGTTTPDLTISYR